MNYLFNAIRTPDGTILESKHRHDFVQYIDEKGRYYSVDGGKEYLKRSCAGDYEEISIPWTDEHAVQRQYLTWGTYGVNGDKPRRDVLIKDLSDAHIQNILNKCNITGLYLELLENEVLFRKANKITVEDTYE